MWKSEFSDGTICPWARVLFSIREASELIMCHPHVRSASRQPAHIMITGSPIRWLVAVLFTLLPFPSGAADSGTSDRVIAIYPVTTGTSHAPSTPISRIVVVSAQTGASVSAALAAARDVFQRGGMTVIDRALPSWPGDTQGPQRPGQKRGDQGFLAFGKSVGADHVVVLEITDTLILDKQKSVANTYLHDERISVRGIGVETGTVVLEGTARWSQPIVRAGDHVRELTTYAIARAICTPEKWVEASAANNGRGRCRP